MSILVVGCDVGSTTGKAVVINEGDIVAQVVIPATTNPERTAHNAMEEALKIAGLSSIENLNYIVGTGYGRRMLSFANENISEITCHARGVNWLCPEVRTVLDIGGQDCKAISLDKQGKVLDFILNDKCAAGTGKFIEAMARVFHTDLEGLSNLALQSKNPSIISTQCSVFAESEVITLINEGGNTADISAGVHLAIAARSTSILKRVGLHEDVAVSGGCAKNEALIKVLSEKLGVNVVALPVDPQVMGALGAALIAGDSVKGGKC